MSEDMNKNLLTSRSKNEDLLEAFLQKAAEDISELDTFYKKLFSSTLYVFARKEDLTQSEQNIVLYHWQLEDHFDTIALFSSYEKAVSALSQLKETENIHQTLLGVEVVSFQARALFALAPNQSFVLNPLSKTAKILYYDELKTAFFSNTSPTGVVKETVEGTLRIFALDELPEKFSEQIITVLKQTSNVKQAFLVGFETLSLNDSEVKEKGFLLAIESVLPLKQEALDDFFMPIGTQLSDYLEENSLLDLCQIKPTDCSISQFVLQHITPIYQRKLGGFIRHALPN